MQIGPLYASKLQRELRLGENQVKSPLYLGWLGENSPQHMLL